MHLIRLNEINDPAINLAIEEYVVRNFDISNDYLYLYVNEPAVIIGKHQNPFEEVNFSFIHSNKIPLFRRISGGGTVYHDLGNLNFCYITESTLQNFNTYKQFLSPIVDYLIDEGVPAKINARNDLVIGNKKISGNAQFTSRKRMMSHGTLLFDAELDKIKSVLRPITGLHESKSTKSKRSPVKNISEYFKPKPAMSKLKKLVEKKICETYNGCVSIRFNENDWKEIKLLAKEKYRAWDWNYRLTPEFSYIASSSELNFQGLIKVKDCNFQQVKMLDDQQGYLKRIWQVLYKKRFEYNNICTLIEENFSRIESDKLVKSIHPF